MAFSNSRNCWSHPRCTDNPAAYAFRLRWVAPSTPAYAYILATIGALAEIVRSALRKRPWVRSWERGRISLLPLSSFEWKIQRLGGASGHWSLLFSSSKKG
jgi:hypothetical protein